MLSANFGKAFKSSKRISVSIVCVDIKGLLVCLILEFVESFERIETI